MASAESRFGSGFRADLGRRRVFVELGAEGWTAKIYNLDKHQFELMKKVDNPELGQKACCEALQVSYLDWEPYGSPSADA